MIGNPWIDARPDIVWLAEGFAAAVAGGSNDDAARMAGVAFDVRDRAPMWQNEPRHSADGRPLCQAITQSAQLCMHYARPDDHLCWQHRRKSDAFVEKKADA